MKKIQMSIVVFFAALFFISSFAMAEEKKKEEVLKLEEVVVTASPIKPETDGAFIPLGSYQHKLDASDRVQSSDTAEMLRDLPGISLRLNGGVATIPGLHGMDDDRVKVLVNGMSITSACSNHMNPPLSYVTSGNISNISLMAGITPVSLGGDSIGGTISVDSELPKFTGPGEQIFNTRGSTYYRSVNQGRGASLAFNWATEHLSTIYSGDYNYADSYKRGNDGPIVRATLFESNTHNLTLATHTDGGGVWALNLGYQKIPRQGFVNQRMDMTNNEGFIGSLNYNKDFSYGNLDVRLYYHQTRHEMDMLPLPERGGNMPMLADGKDLGYRIRAQIPFTKINTLRIGNEYHQFKLQDWYPGGPSSWGQKQDFISINDGKRNRLGTFAEWQTDWNPAWTTLFGIRNDIVWMNTGNVQSYWDNLPVSWAPDPDAVAFNAINRERSDSNFDATALSRHKPNEWSTYEIGLAQKTRSPNLYERYAWRKGNTMINTVGDHNGWRGDPDLKPEVAYTASIIADWHSSIHTDRHLRIAPYFTTVKDYIDGKVEIDWRPYQEPTVGLRYTNVSRAELYGVDMDAAYDINTTWIMRGSLGYTYGSNRDNGEPLYNIMPLHGNVAIEPTFGALKGAIEMEWVARKDRISPTHLELPTDEYTLLNLSASYNKKFFRIDAGIENVLDKLYDLPLGGVNHIESSKTYYKDGFRNFAVPGKGRSLYIGVSVEF